MEQRAGIDFPRVKIVEDLRQAPDFLLSLHQRGLENFVLAPFDAVVTVAEKPHPRALVQQARAAETVLDVDRHRGGQDDEVGLVGQARELGHAHNARSVEAADVLEIEDDVGQLGQARVGLPFPDGVEQIVRAAEKDEALEPQDVDLAALVVEQPRLQRRAVDRAVMAVPGQDVADDIHAAVLEHEQDRGDDDARAHALQITRGGDDGEDEDDEIVVLADQAEIGVEDPLGQEGDAVIKKNAAEDKLRDVAEHAGAEPEAKTGTRRRK